MIRFDFDVVSDPLPPKRRGSEIVDEETVENDPAPPD